MKGQVSRYCTCRGEDGKQLGSRCPELKTNGKHGRYQFLIDLPRVGGRRKEMRRRGFRTSREAHAELERVRVRFSAGVTVNDKESTGDFLVRTMAAKAKTLKPTTAHMYAEYVTKALVPAIGSVRLEHLRHDHVQGMVDELVENGRGATTVRRIVATLSSLLADGVKQRRLTHNACEHLTLPPVDQAEREVWTAGQAVRFMAHAVASGERLAELFEVIIATGLRRGEALALRWPLIDVAARSLHIDPKRGTLSDVAGRLVFTAPKTAGSSAGVGMSARVVAAMVRQAGRQEVERAQWGDAYEDDQLVFCRENGAPLRPKYVLQRFHELSEEAGLPRVRIHDLRHLAVTLMLSEGVPLAVVSKFVRHSQVGITSDLYGHLTREASTAAADGLGAVLDAAAAEFAAEQAMTGATTVRPQDAVPSLLRGRS
jgi:integrase